MDQFEKRRGQTKSYSLRAFAKDLDLKPSTLSDVLNERYGVSCEAATKIAKNLEFTEEETQFFCDLVESKHGRSRAERVSANIRLKKYQLAPEQNRLSEDVIELYNHWYHFAILELYSVFPDENLTAEKAAALLRISVHEAGNAMERLYRVGFLVEENGKTIRKVDHTMANVPVPTDSIRTFHRQVLALASEAISTQPINKRKFISSVFSMDSSRIAECREFLERAHAEFIAKYEESEKPDSVHCVALQLFRIDTP